VKRTIRWRDYNGDVMTIHQTEHKTYEEADREALLEARAAGWKPAKWWQWWRWRERSAHS
jgi:hypothetical protein